MTDVDTYLQTLAAVNRDGAGFLLAYGTTWLVAAVVWRVRGERVGAWAALFQGMVGLPLALLLTAGMARGERVDDPTMTTLSIYLGTGQLLALPLVGVLVARRHHVLAVALLAATTAVHFVPYAWLYQTPLYVVLSALVAVVTATLVAVGERHARPVGAWICASTGAVLLAGALTAYATS